MSLSVTNEVKRPITTDWTYLLLITIGTSTQLYTFIFVFAFAQRFSLFNTPAGPGPEFGCFRRTKTKISSGDLQLINKILIRVSHKAVK